MDRAKGYGMEGVQVDGNNVLTMYDTIRGVRDYCIRNQKPYLVVIIMIDQENVEKYAQDHDVPFSNYASLTRAPIQVPFPMRTGPRY